MENEPRNALITSFLSKTRDRFHEYNQDLTLEERIKTAAQIEGIVGVEVVHRYEVVDPGALRELLDRHGLGIAAVNANVKADEDFRNGGLTSANPTVRSKAVQFIKEAKDFARAVGADKVTCCPLGDGYEFNFHCDYSQMWGYLVESLAEAADYLPEVPLFIEYKPSETRARCFVDTAAKTLCLLHDMASPSVGVTIDFGHSIYGNENPAEVLSLLHGSGHPYYVHINDNDARWDWDLIAGSHHLLDYMEFLYYLIEFHYADYLTSDSSPTRLDVKETFAANARITNKIWARLIQADRQELKRLLGKRDFIKIWKFVEDSLLRF